MNPSSKILTNAWRECWLPEDRRPIHEWAHEFVRLSAPITKVGLFDVSESRHFIDIFKSCRNKAKRETNVLKPVRGGGSLIGDIRTPHAITRDPGPYMDIFQTDQVAKEHAEARIIPIFENCDPVKTLFPHERHKKRNTEIVFNNGCIWYCCGPSLSNLQTKGIRWMRLEEVWMWDQGRMGDALARLGDYLRQQTSHALTISQAGPKDGVAMAESDWYRHYHRAQIFEWEAHCLGCGKSFDPIFSGSRDDGSYWGLNWSKHKLPNGDWNIAKCLPTLRFECQHCAHPHLDNARTKSEWNRTGGYRLATEPNSKRDSFHWEAVIDYPWDELAELFMSADDSRRKGDYGPMIQFYQKRRAIFMDEEGLRRGGLNLLRAPYEIQSEWPDEQMREMDIDRQEEDLFWVQVRAWSKTESRGLYFGKCYGFAECESIREKFKVPPNLTTCDSGYNPKGDHGVYSACIKYGWVAVKGDDPWQFVHRSTKGKMILKSYAPLTYADPSSGTKEGGNRRCPMIRFSKGQMNMLVQRLVDSGVWKEQLNPENPEMAAELSAQMGARIMVRDYDKKTGAVKVFFKESKNDHARDLANQAALKAVLRDLVPDPAAEQLTKSEQKEAA